jgi:uracil-DNA glycosylase
MARAALSLQTLNNEIVACNLCERLRGHCTEVARVRRRAYADWDYWGRPVPSFGDPGARVLALGLAPGAHGSNRTGRPFTGTDPATFYSLCSTKPASPRNQAPFRARTA